ncbi:MAG: hypothetical protein OHK0046_31280 [Anaerolineae bacterium]
MDGLEQLYTLYRVHIRELLGEEWADWFAPMHIIRPERGGTLLMGNIKDKAQLYGLLILLRDLNLTLLSVESEDVPL